MLVLVLGKRGCETWIHDSYSPTYSLAAKIFNEIYQIYPYNREKITKRGVKYARGSIAEASPAYANWGINLELGYHDNYLDACWMVEAREDIAVTIANSLIEFFELDKIYVAI